MHLLTEKEQLKILNNYFKGKIKLSLKSWVRCGRFMVQMWSSDPKFKTPAFVCGYGS